jgi:hypothetical protein
MVLREVELGVDVEMAGEARLWIAARVHNEFSASATDRDVFAAWTVA